MSKVKEVIQDQEQGGELPAETLGVNVTEEIKVNDAVVDDNTKAPVIEVEEIQTGSPGDKKVRVKFLKDLYPQVNICGEWISGKKGDEKFLTIQQARILRSDDTVM